MMKYIKERSGFNLVFEDKQSLKNLVSCNIILENNRPIHDTGSLIQSLLKLDNTLVFDIQSKPPNYIFPVGLYHNPLQWAGHDYNPTYKKSLFELIPNVVIEDLRNNTALLLLDQVQEAWQTRWLYDWFHHNIRQYSIPAENIIYCTGDISSADHYDRYCKENQITNKINILSDMVIQCYDVCHEYVKKIKKPILWTDHISYKTANIENIKLYNCLNRRLSTHRKWLYLRLADENLINDALISMNHFDDTKDLVFDVRYPQDKIDMLTKQLPLTVDTNNFDNNNFLNINQNIYLDSWFTIVTETTATENDDSVMITEKLMKPMLACHPFLVWGNRKTLRYLRDLGFKTFSNSWDESYDIKYDFYRLDHLIENIKQIKNLKDKLEWYKRLEDLVCHNQEIVLKMTWDNSTQCTQLKSIWNNLLLKNGKAVS